MGSVVPAVDEGPDRGGEFADRPVAAAVDGLSFGEGEPDLDQVHPGRVGGGEVHPDPGVGGQPLVHGGVLVGGVVVHHQVQLAVRVGAGYLAQEHQELLVAVSGLAAGGDRAG